ncbi:RT0821/Lpp0805 family surface protein [Paraburkholderia sp. JHI869]|uniref:RT0821/Lpp0805 family surface protein n=1 Tax=Paraburkholderia sp. JHI869 TaxID=3112959 RepID=UPI00316FD381
MSRMPRTLHTLSALGAALFITIGVGSAHAANLGFLNNTPMSFMNQADYNSLQNAVRDAVEHKADGETANWSNEGSRNSTRINSTITPSNTQKEGDKTCRDTEVVITAKGQSMTLRPHFCRVGEGAWKFQKQH